jgi:hypothetical protein
MSATQKAEFSTWSRRDGGSGVLALGDWDYQGIVVVAARRAGKNRDMVRVRGQKNNCAPALFSCVQVQNLYSANANSFCD